MKLRRTIAALAVTSDRDDLARLCAEDIFDEGELGERVWAATYLGSERVAIRAGELEEHCRGLTTSYPVLGDQKVLRAPSFEEAQAHEPSPPVYRCPVRGGAVQIDVDELGKMHPLLRAAIRAWLDEMVVAMVASEVVGG